MKFKLSTILIAIALLSIETCFAKTPPKKVNIESLEGRWKVVSTTWGGNPNDFLQGIFQFKFIKRPTETENKTVQFIVLVDSENTVWNFDNVPFCSMRYERLPDNLTLHNGYPHLSFWELPEYPCGVSKDLSMEVDAPFVPFIGPKYLLRIRIINHDTLLALVYYEYGVGAAAVENSVSEQAKKDEAIKCEESTCIAQLVIGTGVFELRLKKIGKWKEMKEGTEKRSTIPF